MLAPINTPAMIAEYNETIIAIKQRIMEVRRLPETYGRNRRIAGLETMLREMRETVDALKGRDG